MIFCLSMYLRLKLYTFPFFVSGQTYKISKGSNNYCSHCVCVCVCVCVYIYIYILTCTECTTCMPSQSSVCFFKGYGLQKSELRLKGEIEQRRQTCDTRSSQNRSRSSLHSKYVLQNRLSEILDSNFDQEGGAALATLSNAQS